MMRFSKPKEACLPTESWKRQNRWRALMFLMPSMYVLAAVYAATGAERLGGDTAGVALAVATAGLIGVVGHSRALERTERGVVSGAAGEEIMRRLAEDLGEDHPPVLVRRAPEYGDPFFPTRIIIELDGQIVKYDWKNRRIILSES